MDHRHRTQPQILGNVGILILVDQNILELVVIAGQHIGMGRVLKDGQHVQHQIAEITGIQGLQPVLIQLVEQVQPATGEVTGIGSADLVRGQATILPALDHAHQHPWRPGLVVDTLGFHDLLEQPDLVIGIDDVEIGFETDPFRMTAQHPCRERMEGAEPPALDRHTKQSADPLAHLARGFVGEGNRKDLVRCRLAGRQQMRKAGGQRTGLAGTGTGQHQHRTIGGQHRFPLRGVEAMHIWRFIRRRVCHIG